MPQQPNPVGRRQAPDSPQRNGGGPPRPPIFSPPQMSPNQQRPAFNPNVMPQQGTGGPFQIPGRPPMQRQGFIRPNIFPQMHPGWAGYIQWLQSMRR